MNQRKVKYVNSTEEEYVDMAYLATRRLRVECVPEHTQRCAQNYSDMASTVQEAVMARPQVVVNSTQAYA